MNQNAEAHHKKERQQAGCTFHGGAPGNPAIQRGEDGIEVGRQAAQMSEEEAVMWLFNRQLTAEVLPALPKRVREHVEAAGSAAVEVRRVAELLAKAESGMRKADQAAKATADELEKAQAAAALVAAGSSPGELADQLAEQEQVAAAEEQHEAAQEALQQAQRQVDKHRAAWVAANAVHAGFATNPGGAWQCMAAELANPVTPAQQAAEWAAQQAAELEAVGTDEEDSDGEPAQAKPLSLADLKWQRERERRHEKAAAAVGVAAPACGKENVAPNISAEPAVLEHAVAAALEQAAAAAEQATTAAAASPEGAATTTSLERPATAAAGTEQAAAAAPLPQQQQAPSKKQPASKKRAQTGWQGTQAPASKRGKQKAIAHSTCDRGRGRGTPHLIQCCQCQRCACPKACVLGAF